MRRIALLAAAALCATLVACAPSEESVEASATPAASPTSEPSVTPTPSVKPSSVATPSPTPTPSPSPTASAQVEFENSSGTFTATVPASWTLTQSDTSGGPLAGIWNANGNTASIGFENRGGRTSDSDFASGFGQLGPEDGVDVGRLAGTSADGSPIMFVDVVPAGGVGGDSQCSFYVYGSSSVVSGTLTYAGQPGDQIWREFRAVAKSVRFES